MALIETREKKNYISILGSDATLRKVVPEGTVGAVTRTYKDSKDVEHTKIEKVFESVSGKITDIGFVDTEFGTLLQVTLTDEFLPEEAETLSMSTSSEFAQDFMKKLPNIDLSKEVILKPYRFTPEDGKRELKGLTITQEGNKIEKSFVENFTMRRGIAYALAGVFSLQFLAMYFSNAKLNNTISNSSINECRSPNRTGLP